MSINRDADKQKRLFFVVFVYREGADNLKMSESGAAGPDCGRGTGGMKERPPSHA